MKKFLLLLVFTAQTGLVGAVNVITHHNSPQRTGWNAAETLLTPTNITPTTFGLQPPRLSTMKSMHQPLVAR